MKKHRHQWIPKHGPDEKRPTKGWKRGRITHHRCATCGVGKLAR